MPLHQLGAAGRDGAADPDRKASRTTNMSTDHIGSAAVQQQIYPPIREITRDPYPANSKGFVIPANSRTDHDGTEDPPWLQGVDWPFRFSGLSPHDEDDEDIGGLGEKTSSTVHLEWSIILRVLFRIS